MKTAQQGFTLIELVVVIVILGILAATAVPKFIDLTAEAEQAAAEGAAGALSSAAAINYAAGRAGNANAFNMNGQDCTAIAAGILDQDAADSWTGGPAGGEANGDIVTCTAVVGTSGSAASSIIYWD